MAYTDSYSDAELEEIKMRKLLELQRRVEEEKRRREMVESILRQILTPEARSRLANLKLVKPELAETIEQQLVALAQSGRIPTPITDDFLKKLLEQVYEQTRRDFKIRFMRK